MSTTKSDAAFDLRVLGGAAFRRSGGELVDGVIAHPKRVLLLAYLAIAGRGAFVRRDKLVALFWPELDTDHSRGALRTMLHRLRQTLGDDVFVLSGANELRLNERIVSCDASALLNAAERGDDHAVLELFGGELLDGVYARDVAPELEQWIDLQRDVIRQTASDSAWRIVEREEREGRTQEAAARARVAAQLSPRDERALRRLIELLIRLGDEAGAIAAYEDFAQRLAEDLDAVPSDTTASLIAGLRGRRRSSPASERTARVFSPRPVPAFDGSAAGFGDVSPRGIPRWAFAAGLAVTATAYAGVRLLLAAPTDGPRWEELEPLGTPPLARSHPVLLMDSTRRAVLMFGGRVHATVVGDLWRLEAIDSSAPRWTRIDAEPDSISHVAPAPRWLAAAAYAPVRDRVIMFGGAMGYTSPCSDELWILSNASGKSGTPRWHHVPHRGSWPAGRADHRVAYDAATNTLMLLGGHDCFAPVFNDYWVLHNADATTGEPSWERLTPDTSDGVPDSPRSSAVVYNAGSNRLIVRGGINTATRHFADETWVLVNANGVAGRPAWRRLRVGGRLPPSRVNEAYGYDPGTNRLVITHGDGPAGLLVDAWVLIGADGTTPESRWEPLSLGHQRPPARNASGFAFNGRAESLLMIDGQAADGPLNAVWRLRDAIGRAP